MSIGPNDKIQVNNCGEKSKQTKSKLDKINE